MGTNHNSAPEWGPEIPVDGKWPDWLDDEQICRPCWAGITWYGEYGAPARCVHGWDAVTAIKLPANHPIYDTPPVADGEPVAEQPAKTLRDEFAMAALAGLCSQCDAMGEWSWVEADVPAVAYRIADAMLAERERGRRTGIEVLM